MDSLRV